MTQKPARRLDRPDVVWELLHALSVGKTLEESLRLVGVSSSTFYRERRRSELFRGLIDQARADGRARQTADPPARFLTAGSGGATLDANPPPLAGLLRRGSTDAAATTVVVALPSAAGDDGSSSGEMMPAVPGKRLSLSPRSFLAGLERLTRASRIEASKRRATAQVANTDAAGLGIHWLPPQITLFLQVAIAVAIAGSLPLLLGIGGLAAAYLAAVWKLGGLAFKPAPAARVEVVALDDSIPSLLGPPHDLKWLEGTLARRPQAGEDE